MDEVGDFKMSGEMFNRASRHGANAALRRVKIRVFCGHDAIDGCGVCVRAGHLHADQPEIFEIGLCGWRGRGSRLTTRTLDEVGSRISRYLLVNALVNGGFGLALRLGWCWWGSTS